MGYINIMLLYVQQREKGSMQKDYRPCLEKLAGAPPRRKAALIRSLLPGIEAALHSGQSLKDIWDALGNEGLQMTYHVSGAREKLETQLQPAPGETQAKPTERKSGEQLKGGTHLRI